LPLNSVQRCL